MAKAKINQYGVSVRTGDSIGNWTTSNIYIWYSPVGEEPKRFNTTDTANRKKAWWVYHDLVYKCRNEIACNYALRIAEKLNNGTLNFNNLGSSWDFIKAGENHVTA